ncbi:melatonin receptor type 1B-like [Paramacrobiotus metropolitanus]|uniref:melatonin receptor type 1B-like n=1 Tax=Paramacrobiotus metropolitanus TaxID=2943436 RepID=UPI0024457A28|nr:melatonin receptor type 1B-like [Paramacrobiotus metropolitanus]
MQTFTYENVGSDELLGSCRYVLICHHDSYNKIYTGGRTIVLCVAVWTLIYMIELPNHVGWGDNRFSEVFYVCTFANHVHSYALFYIGVGVCIPITLSFLAYLGIYRKVKDSNLVRHRLLSGAVKRTRAERVHRKQRQRLFRQNVKMAQALFRVYIIFVVMWLPVAVVILLGRGKDVDPVWYILTILLAHGNSSINCIVYGASIDHFRRGYLIILGVPRSQLLRCHSHSWRHRQGYRKQLPETGSLQSADLESSTKKSMPELDELQMTDLSTSVYGARLSCSVDT